LTAKRVIFKQFWQGAAGNNFVKNMNICTFSVSIALAENNMYFYIDSRAKNHLSITASLLQRPERRSWRSYAA
jgi:hypothetical protein